MTQVEMNRASIHKRGGFRRAVRLSTYAAITLGVAACTASAATMGSDAPIAKFEGSAPAAALAPNNTGLCAALTAADVAPVVGPSPSVVAPEPNTACLYSSSTSDRGQLRMVKVFTEPGPHDPAMVNDATFIDGLGAPAFFDDRAETLDVQLGTAWFGILFINNTAATDRATAIAVATPFVSRMAPPPPPTCCT